MCRTSREPVRAMAAASSAVMSSKVRWQPAAPCCWMGGISARPTHTALAPRARALKTSMPFSKEPSTKTGIFPRRVFTISGRTSSAGTAEAMIPWWWETRTPPAPASKHFWASWALSTPLMRKGSLVRLQ